MSPPRIAICLRGKCLDKNIHWETGNEKKTDYLNTLNSIKDNIINCNPEYKFDIYLHGWIENLSDIEKIQKDFNPYTSKLEKQIDFSPYYKKIKNYQEILKSRFSHLHGEGSHSYEDINFFGYFNNIFSFAYSVSNSLKLVDQSINYDFIINTRYDIRLLQQIKISNLNRNNTYIDDTGASHSKLFYGDFMHIAIPEKSLLWINFFDSLHNDIFAKKDYENWCKEIKSTSKTGRLDHGIYSPQMIYAYFSQKHTTHDNVVKNIRSGLFRY